MFDEIGTCPGAYGGPSSQTTELYMGSLEAAATKVQQVWKDREARSRRVEMVDTCWWQ